MSGAVVCVGWTCRLHLLWTEEVCGRSWRSFSMPRIKSERHAMFVTSRHSTQLQKICWQHLHHKLMYSGSFLYVGLWAQATEIRCQSHSKSESIWNWITMCSSSWYLMVIGGLAELYWNTEYVRLLSVLRELLLLMSIFRVVMVVETAEWCW